MKSHTNPSLHTATVLVQVIFPLDYSTGFLSGLPPFIQTSLHSSFTVYPEKFEIQISSCHSPLNPPILFFCLFIADQNLQHCPWHFVNLFLIEFIYLFFKHILLIMLLHLSHFPPFTPLHPAHPLLPHSPAIVHVHGSYISILWLLHFLHYSYPPPVYFPPVIYATYSLYLYPPLPLPLPY